MTRVFVAGGGIVGLCCALQTQRRGHEVVLADPRGFANGASSGNAGVIANSDCVPVATPGALRQVPRMLFAADSPVSIRWAYAAQIAPWLFRFVKASRQAQVDHAVDSLAQLLARAKPAHLALAASVDAAHLIRQVGWLKVFQTEASLRRAMPDFDRMQAKGVVCRQLDRDALAACEPQLAKIFVRGVLHDDCAQIEDPQAYVNRLGEEFLRNGGRLVKSEVMSLDTRHGRVRAARTRTEEFDADCFVVAAGAWSRKLARDAGADVPLDTERGYHVELEAESGRPLNRPVYWAEKSIVMSPSEGRLRVTSSVEFAGLHAPPDFSKLKSLIPHIRGAVGTASGKVVAEWLGFRPSMPDSLPVIAVAPGANNCVLAFGHGHLGLTMGPVTGEIVAALVDGTSPQVDIAAFSADRFD